MFVKEFLPIIINIPNIIATQIYFTGGGEEKQATFFFE
jgi:hypothetical protein